MIAPYPENEAERVEALRRDDIRDAQIRLQAVLDAATEVAIIAMDSDDTITVFNRGAEWMLAYDAKELIGTHTPVILHLSAELEARRRELSARFGRPFSGFDVLVEEARRGAHEERDWTYVRKDGQQIPVTLMITGILAAQIIGASDSALGTKLDAYKRSLGDKVGEGIAVLKQQFPNTFDK